MKDTLQTLIKTIYKAPSDSIELINKVDSFYNSAWDKLIIIGTIGFGIIGILVPIVIQWYQNKTLKVSEQLLKKEIETRSLELKTELLKDINKTLEERLKVFENQIEKAAAQTNAKAFQLQGNMLFGQGLFSNALADFILAAHDHLFCEDYSNLQSILNFISNSCLPKLSHNQIMDLKISKDIDLESLLDEVEKKDNKRIFTSITREIRLKLSKLPKQ